METGSKYVDNYIKEKCVRFSINYPTTVFILPENIEKMDSVEKLVFQSSTKTLKKIFEKEHILFSLFSAENSSIEFLHEKAADLVLPAIMVGYQVLQQNPEIMSIMLNVISNFIYDFMKGSSNSRNVKVKILVEENENGKIHKIEYEGDYKGLNQIRKLIKGL